MEVNTTDCFPDAEMTSWPPAEGRTRANATVAKSKPMLCLLQRHDYKVQRDKHVIYYYKVDPGSSRYLCATPGKSSEGVSASLGTVPACTFVEVRVQITIGLSRSAPARWPPGP